MSQYHESIKELVELYLVIFDLSEPREEKLKEFMEEIVKGCNEDMPICKLNRWLGYVQGVLIERGFTTVETERECTRALFRPLDYPANNNA